MKFEECCQLSLLIDKEVEELKRKYNLSSEEILIIKTNFSFSLGVLNFIIEQK